MVTQAVYLASAVDLAFFVNFFDVTGECEELRNDHVVLERLSNQNDV